MMQGEYCKEWSSALGREMEFKVYGHAGVPVLALPARGGRFYDWENNGMPDAAAQLLNEGRLRLFCADSVDGESLLAEGAPLRRRAEMQEKYFCYLSRELAARIGALCGADAAKGIWCVGVDTGAYQAINCRLRRPQVFCGAVGLSGLYDTARFFGAESAGDDLVLRNSPLLALRAKGVLDTPAPKQAAEDALLLCAGQGSYEDEALADTRALSEALAECAVPCRTEIWGGDVSHDWYWWGKEFALFAERIADKNA